MVLPADCHRPLGTAPDEYRRRRPEETALHQTLAEFWPTFVERIEESGGTLPAFVVREVEAFLQCGILRHGFLVAACDTCGFERLVAFSCKRRGFCPSCVGRRMNDTAVHLVERVLPQVRIRQWVCSLPHRLRYMVGYDAKLCSEVIGAFIYTVSGYYRRKAKREHRLRSMSDAFTGAVTFVQRFDSALRLNVHAHTLGLDGVYVTDDTTAELTFLKVSPPTEAELSWVAARTSERVERILARHGRSLDPEQDDACDAFTTDQPALASMLGSAVSGLGLMGNRKGQPTLRIVAGMSTPADRRVSSGAASVNGFNVHAQVAVDGRDRRRLERICRYIARPPIAQERLERLPDGRLRYTMKKPWSDGTHALLFEPMNFIARLCALIPAPRFHLVRFHGVLAPHSLLRSRVVPVPPSPPSRGPAQLSLFGNTESPVHPPPIDAPKTVGRKRWAWLLRHVFKVDVTVCPRCSGSMKIKAVANTAQAIDRILHEHGLAELARPPPTPTSLGQISLPL